MVPTTPSTRPTQIKGHEQDDDQGLVPDQGTQTVGFSRQSMPCQTHHLQHVHQKQTTLGPKGLSATHFPKMLLSRLGGVCFTCIAQTLVHVAVSTHWTFWAIRHATPLCNELHTHQESEHATSTARIEELSTRAFPRRWARVTKLPKRTPCRWF